MSPFTNPLFGAICPAEHRINTMTAAEMAPFGAHFETGASAMIIDFLGQMVGVTDDDQQAMTRIMWSVPMMATFIARVRAVAEIAGFGDSLLAMIDGEMVEARASVLTDTIQVTYKLNPDGTIETTEER